MINLKVGVEPNDVSAFFLSTGQITASSTWIKAGRSHYIMTLINGVEIHYQKKRVAKSLRAYLVFKGKGAQELEAKYTSELAELSSSSILLF